MESPRRIVTLLACICAAALTLEADPDPVVDIPAGANASFVYSGYRNGVPNEHGSGGDIFRVNIGTFPAVKMEGISYSIFVLKPCGINIPHTHPRATELLFLISGRLRAGFVATDGTFIENVLLAGDVTIFPRGLLHFELNDGDTTAVFISALNSENPGVLAARRLFNLPTDIVAGSLSVSQQTVLEIEAGLPPCCAPVLPLSYTFEEGHCVMHEMLGHPYPPKDDHGHPCPPKEDHGHPYPPKEDHGHPYPPKEDHGHPYPPKEDHGHPYPPKDDHGHGDKNEVRQGGQGRRKA